MLPDRIVDPNRDVRMVLTGLGGACFLPFLLAFWGNLPVIAAVLIGVCATAVILGSSVYWPYTVLSREGVVVRFLFRKKFYGWNEIMQAGRYWRDRKSPASMRFSLVLVFAGGSPKRPGKDRSFLERNLMKAIALPNDREVRLFIVENYGHLDFDDYKGISSWEKKEYGLDKT